MSSSGEQAHRQESTPSTDAPGERVLCMLWDLIDDGFKICLVVSDKEYTRRDVKSMMHSF